MITRTSMDVSKIDDADVTSITKVVSDCGDTALEVGIKNRPNIKNVLLNIDELEYILKEMKAN